MGLLESAGCAPRCLSYMDTDPILIKPHPTCPKMCSVSVLVGRVWLAGLNGGQRDRRRAGTLPQEWSSPFPERRRGKKKKKKPGGAHLNHAATCRLMPSEEISSQEPLEWCARGGDGNGGKRRAGKGGGGITVPPSPVVEAGSRIRARRFFWQIPQETLALGVPPARCGDARKPGSVPKCHRCWSHHRASSWPPPEERGDLIL